jgi:hypothetical protein
MGKPPANEVLADWITRINDDALNLTDWETEFMEAVTEQWINRRWLTARQIALVEHIFREKVP